MPNNIRPIIFELLVRLQILGLSQTEISGITEASQGAISNFNIVFVRPTVLPSIYTDIDWRRPHQQKTVSVCVSWRDTGFSQHPGPECRARFQKRSDHSLWRDPISFSQFLDPIGFHERSYSDWLTDPSDTACYVDRCWIRNFITTIDYFCSNVVTVTIHNLPGNIH